MTPRQRWPRHADECRTSALQKAREGQRRCDKLLIVLTASTQREAVLEIKNLLLEIELKMEKARGEGE